MADVDQSPASRRARARRMALVLALVALSFYVAFIAMQVMESRQAPPARPAPTLDGR
jgi:hypothetical protein